MARKHALTMTVEGGNFRTGHNLVLAAGPVMQPAVTEAAADLRDHLKQGTPQISGHLARGWMMQPALHQAGTTNRFISPIYNNVVYLRRVNLTSKQNAGFVERALKSGSPEVRRRIKSGAIRLHRELWEPKK